MTATRIVPQDAPTLASDAELAAHEADTTSVHGIADTSALSLTSHDHDADYEAAGGIATHSADSTAVHGIADTSVLATATDVSGAVSTHAGLADPHTGYRLESADHSHATTGLQGGTVAHTALTSVGIDDHHARDHAINAAVHTGTLDDAQIPAGIARDAEVATAVSDHAALADPHAGYRLESADHTHATTGLQAGQVAHSALSGITANDHHAQLHATAHEPGGGDVMAVDAAAATGSLRTLGTGAAQAAVGSHTHSGASTLYAPGSFTIATGNFALMTKQLELTTSQRVTIEGTARLRID